MYVIVLYGKRIGWNNLKSGMEVKEEIVKIKPDGLSLRCKDNVFFRSSAGQTFEQHLKANRPIRPTSVEVVFWALLSSKLLIDTSSS